MCILTINSPSHCFLQFTKHCQSFYQTKKSRGPRRAPCLVWRYTVISTSVRSKTRPLTSLLLFFFLKNLHSSNHLPYRHTSCYKWVQSNHSNTNFYHTSTSTSTYFVGSCLLYCSHSLMQRYQMSLPQKTLSLVLLRLGCHRDEIEWQCSE